VLAGVGLLFVIMGIVVCALLGRAVVLCVQWTGKLGERVPRKIIVQRKIPLQQPWDA
jgi:hypothetical protein